MDSGPPPQQIGYYYQHARYNLIISIVFPILNTIVVSLRFYSRNRKKLSLQIDDWLTLPALVRKAQSNRSKYYWFNSIDMSGGCLCYNDHWQAEFCIYLTTSKCDLGIAKHANGYPRPLMAGTEVLIPRSEIDILNPATITVAKVGCCVFCIPTYWYSAFRYNLQSICYLYQG